MSKEIEVYKLEEIICQRCSDEWAEVYLVKEKLFVCEDCISKEGKE